jgi:hypothetical protein
MQILRKFGIAKLRDFVRGRGRGSISRLSFSGDQEKLIEPELVSEKVDEQQQQRQQPEDIAELTEIGTPPTNLVCPLPPFPAVPNNFLLCSFTYHSSILSCLQAAIRIGSRKQKRIQKLTLIRKRKKIGKIN